MIYLIIGFFINSQTHCSSYIKPSLGNSGLFNMHFMMLIKKKNWIYIFPFQYGIFNGKFKTSLLKSNLKVVRKQYLKRVT